MCYISGMKKTPVVLRFWKKVRKTPTCWMWTGCKDSGGYGMIRTGSVKDGTRTMTKATRMSWEIQYGPIPEGMHVLHRCDTPSCVHPDHLFLGTHTDNMRDRKAKGRGNHRRGSIHGRAKLTEADVLAIREKYASLDWTQMDLAAEYGVSQPMIGYIVRRTTWRHI